MARRLPLNALSAFEAVARTGSITLAAAGLGLAPSSVSRMIGNLESAIGFRLFDRRARGSTLTGEGRLLYETTRRALGDIHAMRTPAAGEVADVRITTLPSIAAYWLPTFWKEAERPGTRLVLDATLALRRPGDFPFDLSIRYGDGSWKEMAYRPLFPGREVAVATPQIAQRYTRDDLLPGWSRATMLHDRYFDSWHRWCAAHRLDGLPPSQGNVVFDDRVTLIEATLAGAGVALLPDPLVVGHLRSGALQLLPARPISVKDTYYVAAATGAGSAVVDELLERIVARAGDDYSWLSQQVSERSP